MRHPDPNQLYPMEGLANTVFLKPLLEQNPIGNISVGEYSYYSDHQSPLEFFTRNVRYNFDRNSSRLSIGKFCAFAHGVQFIMADANHSVIGPSTYPFTIFGGRWEEQLSVEDTPFLLKGDITIGHDVWLGTGVTIMPGVRVGHGSIVGSNATVAKDVPDYAVVVGNPGRVVKMRFPDEEIATLLSLNWWDWPIEHIDAAVPLLVKGQVWELEIYANKNQPQKRELFHE